MKLSGRLHHDAYLFNCCDVLCTNAVLCTNMHRVHPFQGECITLIWYTRRVRSTLTRCEHLTVMWHLYLTPGATRYILSQAVVGSTRWPAVQASKASLFHCHTCKVPTAVCVCEVARYLMSSTCAWSPAAISVSHTMPQSRNAICKYQHHLSTLRIAFVQLVNKDCSYLQSIVCTQS
jgi:hypothetical protein